MHCKILDYENTLNSNYWNILKINVKTRIMFLPLNFIIGQFIIVLKL